MSWTDIVTEILAARAQQEDDRHKAVMDELANIKDMLMSLAPEVKALHDAVTAQGVAITDVTTEVGTLEASVSSLQAQLAAIQGGAPIDAEDLAEIVANTNTIVASVQTIRNALPQPIPTTTVDAAAAASSA
jgi:predicted  nucleic acid-binding Zn-ribbon protein